MTLVVYYCLQVKFFTSILTSRGEHDSKVANQVQMIIIDV